jgi:hypothetical protein
MSIKIAVSDVAPELMKLPLDILYNVSNAVSFSSLSLIHHAMHLIV